MELTNEPVKYLSWRFKDLIEQERMADMYIKTQEMPRGRQIISFDKDLDVPTGAIKDNFTFSHKTFMIGQANKKLRRPIKEQNEETVGKSN